MPRTLEQLEAMRDALEDARFAGVRQLSHQGKTVTYTSDSEMAAALRAIERKIAALKRPTISTVRFSTSKGL